MLDLYFFNFLRIYDLGLVSIIWWVGLLGVFEKGGFFNFIKGFREGKLVFFVVRRGCERMGDVWCRYYWVVVLVWYSFVFRRVCYVRWCMFLSCFKLGFCFVVVSILIYYLEIVLLCGIFIFNLFWKVFILFKGVCWGIFFLLSIFRV